MLRARIEFTDRELDLIAKESNLSKLEIIGIISIMNRFAYSDEQIARYEHDEMMGRNIY